MLAVTLAWGAGVDPRPMPNDYPAHVRLEKAALGAEYMVHSFSAQGQTFLVPGHLVIEAAVYPGRDQRFMVAASHFTLRVNGRKALLSAQTPGMVAAALKYPDWERRPELVVGGGIGDTGVIIGGRQPVERFPGDPRPGQRRLPAPPRAPAEGAGVEKQPQPRPEELVIEAALPEGESAHPVAGYLYFAYKGKTRAIRSLELIYKGPAGECVLRLI